MREEAPGTWLALVRPGRKAPPGQQLIIEELHARVRDAREDGADGLILPREKTCGQAWTEWASRLSPLISGETRAEPPGRPGALSDCVRKAIRIDRRPTADCILPMR